MTTLAKLNRYRAALEKHAIALCKHDMRVIYIPRPTPDLYHLTTPQ